MLVGFASQAKTLLKNVQKHGEFLFEDTNMYLRIKLDKFILPNQINQEN
ncbi:MAG: hypothetical protein DID91_2727702839 [Candidatus Nitrotoga sp. MKT]|nr:MAG: hypothetical protein DID91_2727702839 [Candidatus Nitrotoga sp. MKT]